MGWAKCIRAIVKCFHCGKAQCIYTTTEEDYKSAMADLQQKLESVSSCFCGDLLFDDDHHLSRVILKRKASTYKSLVEKILQQRGQKTQVEVAVLPPW